MIIPSHGRFVGASSIPFSEYKRRPGDRVGLKLAYSQRVRQTSRPSRRLRYQLVEVVCQCSASRFDGRSRLPLALRNQHRNASNVRRASNVRVLHQNRRPRSNRRRMEAASRTARQPLVRLLGRKCGCSIDGGGFTVRHRQSSNRQKQPSKLCQPSETPQTMISSDLHYRL